MSDVVFFQSGTGTAGAVQDAGKVVHLYTADSNPCFGELALM